MSLVVTTCVPEGIILASDSRQTLTLEVKKGDGSLLDKLNIVNSDFVNKTFALKEYEIGINTFGRDLIKGIPTASYIRQFEETLLKKDNIESITKKLLDYFKKIDSDADIGFHLAGYLKESEVITKKEVSNPHIYLVNIKKNILERKNVNSKGEILFGANWGGEHDIIAGLLKFGDPNALKIAWEAMNLQDAIDFSTFSISTTINTMRFQARAKTVGGPIDVLLITPEEVRWVQKKEFHGGAK